jgi:hypothetical protein
MQQFKISHYNFFATRCPKNVSGGHKNNNDKGLSTLSGGNHKGCISGILGAIADIRRLLVAK